MTSMRKYTYTYYYIYICLAACALFVLGGCKLGKQYVRPELALPESLSASDSLGADTLSIADLPWEQLYTDTLLHGLISRTLEYNKDLLMASARIKELAALKRIDVANFFPEVGLRVYAERERENNGGDHYVMDDEFDLKGTVSWELDLWGKLRWARDESLAEFRASVETRRALQMSLVADVAQAYFELVALDNELAIVRQTVDARRESLHLVRLRFEGGLTSEIPYRQAQVELARTTALIPDLERQITLKENELSLLVGEYPHRMERATMLEDIRLPETLPVGLPSTLLERRPDIREAEQQLIYANAAVGVAYTSMFPNITLTATYGLESDLLREFLKSPHHLLGANLLQPIVGIAKNRARLKARKAARERAYYAYEKAVLSAFKDAYDAIAAFNKMEEIYDTRLSLERSSRTALPPPELQFVTGSINYLDLLDAQRGYLDAQINLSNAVRDKQITIVHLYKALGGGW